jgi:hypothetical protein
MRGALSYIRANARRNLFTGLLDLYPGAAAAYSLRALSESFLNSDLVLVRRSSDNAELGFTAAEITDGTLTTWTGANDGFVVTWYDQSGSARNATQATAGNQPMIVDAGVLVTDDERPSILFSGGEYLSASNPSVSFQSLSSFVLSSVTSGTAFVLNTVPRFYQPIGRTGYNSISYNTLEFSVLPGTQGEFSLTSLLAGSGAVNIYENGSLITTGASDVGVSQSIRLGFNGGSAYQVGKTKETVLYSSDQSANRTGIESNIATQYGITLP